VKDSQMGMHIGAQRYANCCDQGFKCFATHLSWNRFHPVS